jgi:hypothetical protein
MSAQTSPRLRVTECGQEMPDDSRVRNICSVFHASYSQNRSQAHHDLFNGVAEAAYNCSAREFATGCLEGTRIDVL